MDKYKQSKNIPDLATALLESEQYAKRGHKLAGDAVSLLKRTVDSISRELQRNIITLEQSNINERNTIRDLSNQLALIKQNFEEIPRQLGIGLKETLKSPFSIALFGRTMSGKSTLMEILTHGDGTSIGKGAQRTTRDVRTYPYNNMIIIDVPGIAAFEGQEDEDVAFEAAKKCDLVLFLITDDAPQPSEADCLNRILGSGKPVICILNAKVNIDSGTNLKMFARDIRKKMNMDRLNSIRAQFLEFGTPYGKNWGYLPFAYVHLKSAYLSQQTEWELKSNELYKMSRFDYLEGLIIKEIIKNGKFYKLKSPFDIVVRPVIDAFETLFKQSAQNSEQGSILIGKRKKLKKWTDNFKSDAKKRIESFLAATSGELRKEVASFAEYNYDNPSAEHSWKSIIQSHNIESKAEGILKELEKECEEELQEICREINSELKFSHTVFSDKSINMPYLIDGKRVWNWATALAGGGLIIAGLFVLGPIGLGLGFIVGLMGWLGSLFFSDYERKVLDARRKMEKKLIASIDKMISSLKKKMFDVLYDKLLKKQLYSTLNAIDEIVTVVFKLSEIQRNFAKTLNTRLYEMNKVIITEALNYTGFSGCKRHIMSAVRSPNDTMIIMLEDGDRFPEDARKALSGILKEHVRFVFNTNSLKSILVQAIGKGCDRNSVRIQYIDDEPRIARISNIDNLDAKALNRVQLAQQLTGLLIMK
ncbi:MAG: GTPase [Natronincolaceae bacterium]|jgi:GTP-binding protein EngB required for normal cell division|nr:GTPase [Clostridiales bacterium]